MSVYIVIQHKSLDIRLDTNFKSTCTCLPIGKFSIHINKFTVFRSLVFQVKSEFQVMLKSVSVNFQTFPFETDGVSMFH